MKKIRIAKIEEKNLEFVNKCLRNFKKIFLHGKVILGPEISNLEHKIKKYLGIKYVLLTGSGTDSLFMALKSLNIQKDSEVILSPLSWVSPANVVVLNDLKPVFADIGHDLNISVDSIKKLINKKTKAIIVVHYAGRPANITQILQLCKKNNIFLIEDCAHAYGSSINLKKCGTFGKLSCFSFNPMKVIGSMGDLGAVATNNKILYNKLKILRYAGTRNKLECIDPSLNFKPDPFQASVLFNRLKDVNKILKKREFIKKFYDRAFPDKIKLPNLNKGHFSTNYLYFIKVNKRNKLINVLNKNFIESKIETPRLIPEQKFFKNMKFEKNNNFSNIIHKKILSLPIHEKLKLNEIKKITKIIKEFTLND